MDSFSLLEHPLSASFLRSVYDMLPLRICFDTMADKDAGWVTLK